MKYIFGIRGGFCLCGMIIHPHTKHYKFVQKITLPFARFCIIIYHRHYCSRKKTRYAFILNTRMEI